MTKDEAEHYAQHGDAEGYYLQRAREKLRANHSFLDLTEDELQAYKNANRELFPKQSEGF